MSQPTLKDVETLLRKGENFAPGTRMAAVMRVIKRMLLEEALAAIDKGGSIAVQCKNGAIVRYQWDPVSRGWQATL